DFEHRTRGESAEIPGSLKLQLIKVTIAADDLGRNLGSRAFVRQLDAVASIPGQCRAKTIQQMTALLGQNRVRHVRRDNPRHASAGTLTRQHAIRPAMETIVQKNAYVLQRVVDRANEEIAAQRAA